MSAVNNECVYSEKGNINSDRVRGYRGEKTCGSAWLTVVTVCVCVVREL